MQEGLLAGCPVPFHLLPSPHPNPTHCSRQARAGVGLAERVDFRVFIQGVRRGLIAIDSLDSSLG